MMSWSWGAAKRLGSGKVPRDYQSRRVHCKLRTRPMREDVLSRVLQQEREPTFAAHSEGTQLLEKVVQRVGAVGTRCRAG